MRSRPDSGSAALCELVDGTLVEKPVGLYESVLAGIILELLRVFVRPRRLGIVGGEQGMMRVVPGQLRMPDVSFTSWARLPADYPANPAPRVSPDLAVEVLSLTNTAAEMTRKRAEYFVGGTRLVWIVDPPTRTVAVYTSAAAEPTVVDAAGTVDGGDVLPGFTLSVADPVRPGRPAAGGVTRLTWRPRTAWSGRRRRRSAGPAGTASGCG